MMHRTSVLFIMLGFWQDRSSQVAVGEFHYGLRLEKDMVSFKNDVLEALVLMVQYVSCSC